MLGFRKLNRFRFCRVNIIFWLFFLRRSGPEVILVDFSLWQELERIRKEEEEKYNRLSKKTKQIAHRFVDGGTHLVYK